MIETVEGQREAARTGGQKHPSRTGIATNDKFLTVAAKTIQDSQQDVAEPFSGGVGFQQVAWEGTVS